MDQPQMFTAVDAALLAEALPMTVRSEATQAAEWVLGHLNERQWMHRFQVRVQGENVAIPYRLHFSSDVPSQANTEVIYLIGACFEARSNDGFQRQRAVRKLLNGVQPWSMPFIMALIGEYVVEIISDIHEGLTPQLIGELAKFIVENPSYFYTTQQRVVSYWNVYYRRQIRRSDYVGFKLLDTLAEATRFRV